MFRQGILYVGRNLRRHFEPRGQRIILAVRRRAVDSGGLQSSTGFKRRVTRPVDGRPATVRSPRREFTRVALGTETPDQTVHPTKAQCFVERILVINRSDPGVHFVEDEPYLGL